MTGQTLENIPQPLTETALFILLSLANGPRHGYAIIKDVQHLSQGRIVLSAGTLYGAVKRMVEQGWIERINREEGEEEPDGPGLPRKDYRLSELGRRLLKAETTRLESVLAAIRMRVEEGLS